MRGVNKVILIGTLGRDPETKTFDNGGSITQFSIATSEKWNDKVTGEPKEHTEWHRIVASNRLGEIAQQYLRKGSKVYIEGSLRTRQWKDQNGQDRYSTDVRADQLQMLDSRPAHGDGFQPPAYQNSAGYGQNSVSAAPNVSNAALGGYGALQSPMPPQSDYSATAPSTTNRSNQPTSFGSHANDIDDDLPF